ncbi:MAG: ABC transporter ATP-binding protein [Pseudomonadota bacterium]
MTHPKLELINIHKDYDDGDVVAVDGIDMIVERGETVALLGPSGCGKSTTLNMIVGLEQPTSGEILVDGHSVVGVPAGKRNIGLVFQDYAVFTHMTVEKNLAFGLEVAGMARPEISRRVGEVVELLGLKDLLKQKASNLGGSQLQRVAIGRTLVTQPAILLLDEPLSNLESEARAAMRRELRRLQGEIGLTIIYVTHDQTEALSLAGRVAVMSAGKIKQFDETATVYDAPAHRFVASFIGDPAMNLLHGKLETQGQQNGLRVADALLTLPANLSTGGRGEGAQMIFGIRPEALSIVSPHEGAFSATVTQVASRGAEAVVTLEALGSEIAIVVPSHGRPSLGDTVSLAPDAEAIVLFCGESGLNLAASSTMEIAA